MNQSALGITDVVLRDAHQSLLATRMRIDDMLPIAEKLDQVGFWSLESWGGATFDACIRYLGEDPWQRIRLLKQAMPNTPQQMLLRGQNLLGYRHYADDVVEAFVQKCADNGMDVFRVFDALNDLRNIEVAMKAVKKAGKYAQGTICFTTSPVHTAELFVKQAEDIRDMGADSIAIKDMAGLLTPYDTGDLVAAIKSAVDLPLVIHSHSTSGLAPLCQLKAIEAGADEVGLADTTGMANPASIRRIFKAARAEIGADKLGGAHLHNTRGLGLANALAALDVGVTTIDSSMGGLGGCPFAPGASGNIVTEDLAFMLEEMGLKTGINIEKLMQIREIIKVALPEEPLYGFIAQVGLQKGGRKMERVAVA